MDGMARAGWPDGFRHLHGNRREYTWYSPNKGNGFRLDEAFVHRSLLPRLDAVRYEWGRDGSSRRDAVSDHAAVIVELRAES
jgi:exonuclease III